MSNYPSETSKYLKLTTKYCFVEIPCPENFHSEVKPGETISVPGCGIDIASQGSPVVPWAWSLDLYPEQFAWYNSGHLPRGPLQIRGSALRLSMIESDSLDFVYSSHLLEDFADWTPALKEWVRVLKPGGNLIILIPDRERWVAACAAGQPPNDFHRHEGKVGELSLYANELGLEVIEDRLTDLDSMDYSILFVGRKK